MAAFSSPCRDRFPPNLTWPLFVTIRLSYTILPWYDMLLRTLWSWCQNLVLIELSVISIHHISSSRVSIHRWMKRISRNHHAVDRCRNPFQHNQLDHAEVSTGLRQKRTTPFIVQYVRCTSGFGRFVNYPMRSQCCMRAGVKERNYAADKQAKQISIRKRHRCCGSLSWRMLPSRERKGTLYRSMVQ